MEHIIFSVFRIRLHESYAIHHIAVLHRNFEKRCIGCPLNKANVVATKATSVAR